MPVNPCFLNQATKRDIAKLSPDDVSMFWRYAKENGLFKGLNPDETRLMIADKFKVPERVVGWIMERNKTARTISEEARARQKITANFLANNRRYLADMDKSGAQKLLNLVSQGVNRTLLYAHGPVFSAIHPLDLAVTNPIKFIRQYGRGLGSVSKNLTDNVMAKLAAKPNYKMWVDAGLPIAKQDISGEGFPHRDTWATRANDAALKPLRYELAQAKWKRTSPEDQTPDMAKKISIEYAHATGTLVKGEKFEVMTRGIRRALLAPMYTPSKIAKSIFDPLETARTLERMAESKVSSKITPPTHEERIIAYNRLWRASRYLGGTFGALAVNEALLRHFGSKQRVNYDKPIRSDWMAFKFGGHSYRMRGSMEIIALIAKVAAISQQKHKFGQQTPEEAIARYGEYKLTPGIGLGKELLTGKDIFGRPVPWSKETGSARFPRKNYMEFVGEHGPIFLGHAISMFHEMLRNQGVDTRQSSNVMRAIVKNPQAALKAAEEAAVAGGAEFFGVNIQPDRYVGKD